MLTTCNWISENVINNFRNYDFFSLQSNSEKIFIFSSPPEKRQSMLFSATQTRKVEDLARISLKKEPLYVGVDDNKDTATVEGLEQVNGCSISISSSRDTRVIS